MMSQSSSVRSNRESRSRLYGLVDAAARPEQIHALLMQSGEAFRSVYAGLPEEEMDRASLFLVPISDTRADWFMELDRIDLHTPCLSLLESRVDPDSLITHLQAFLFAEIGDNMTAMIRFFDPRNTSAVLDIWGKQIREMFMGPIERWTVRGRRENWRRIQTGSQPTGRICNSILVRLDQAETDALMAHTEPDELLAVLIENEAVDGTRPYLERFTDFLPRYRRALQWGITEPGDRLLFCQYSYLYGAAFDRHRSVHEALLKRKSTGEAFRLTVSRIPMAVWDDIARNQEKLLAVTTG